jgi:superfamily II DNA or RNA helicase
MSYRMEGAQFSAAYRAGTWDGRIRLLRRWQRGLSWPSGLDRETLQVLRKAGWRVEVVDNRPTIPSPLPYEWRGPPLRGYQREAIDAILAHEGGILRLPIRSGKTLTAAGLIHRLRCRALFVVPSDLLLRQTRAALEGVLGDCSITSIGAGEWDSSGDIVVATIQTLLARSGSRSFARELTAGRFPLVVVDEVHHQSGSDSAWRDVLLSMPARYRVGLSATVYLDRRRRCQSSSIWLRGLCGPIVYSASTSDLIDAGYLVRPAIRWVEHGAPEDLCDDSWQSAYARCVVACEERNAAIVREATRYAREGLGVLVDTARVGHAQELGRLIRSELGANAVAVLLGRSSRSERAEVLRRFPTDVQVICGTILGEGIDVPTLEVVINAEGGKDRVPVIQRMRCLTPCSDLGRPKRAIVVEMVDRHHPILRKWTRARMKIYASERGFRQELP